MNVTSFVPSRETTISCHLDPLDHVEVRSYLTSDPLDHAVTLVVTEDGICVGHLLLTEAERKELRRALKPPKLPTTTEVTR